jgi:putative membrane protein
MSLAMTLGAVVADRNGMMDGGDGDGWMWVWGVVCLLLVVAVIGLIAWAIARSTPRGPRPNDRAREILADRLARGEITPEEYRDRVQHLG